MFVESGCSAEFLRVGLHPRRDFLVEEILYAVGLDGIKLSVHGDADALLALAEAERACELYLVLELVLFDEVSQLVDYLARALDVAGAADTYGDF